MGVYYENKSLKEVHERKKSMEELTAENKALKEQLEAMEANLTDTQVALCDVYELLVGGEA
jgi:cell division protein FtsB